MFLTRVSSTDTFSIADALSFIKEWNSHIAAPSCTLLIFEANLKVFRKRIIEMGSKRLKVCGFICAVMSFAILAMYLETVPRYFVEVSTER